MFKLSKEIEENIKNKKIIIGVSSGVDSISLLHFLMKNGYKEQCVIAHVHHGFRQESDEEYQFIKNLSALYNIPFEGIHLNILEYMKNNNLTNDEKTARDLRYSFYKKLSKKYQTNIIMLGHHGDDLIEGVLMKFVNGVYGKGLIQMQPIHSQNNYTFIRPLLNYSKEEIYNYAIENDLEWREDISNKDDKYTRNRFRNHIIPLLKEENPQLMKAIHQFSSIRLEEEDYFDKVVNKHYEEIVNINEFNIISIEKEVFLSLEPFLQRRLIYLVFTKQFDNVSIKGNLLDILKEKISNNENTDYQLIVDGCYVVNSKHKFYLMGEKKEKEDKYIIINNKKFKKLFTDKKVPTAFRFLLYKDNTFKDVLNNEYNKNKVLDVITYND